MAVTPGFSRTRASRLARGFSLVEATVSMVLVAVLMTAALRTVGASARRHRLEHSHDLLLPLAHGLLHEILQAHYEDPDEDGRTFGPESDETAGRPAFDDVDDYHGWTSMPPTDRFGVELTDLDDVERSVVVELIDPASPSDPGAEAATPADQGLKRITVTARRDGQPPVRLVAWRSRAGAYDREPAVESTYVRWVGVTMALGEQGPPTRSGVSVLNQVAVEDGP